MDLTSKDNMGTLEHKEALDQSGEGELLLDSSYIDYEDLDIGVLDFSSPSSDELNFSDLDSSIDSDSDDGRPKTSFLDLPNEIRNEIYKLAIYDHDRTTVFLPRNVPRKVTHAHDVDVEFDRTWPITETHEMTRFTWPGNDGTSRAAGVWVTEAQCLTVINDSDSEADEDPDVAGAERGAENLETDDADNFQSALMAKAVSLLTSTDTNSDVAGETEVAESFVDTPRYRELEEAEDELAAAFDERLCGGGPADEEDEDESLENGQTFTICHCPCQFHPENTGTHHASAWQCEGAVQEEICHCHCHVDHACHDTCDLALDSCEGEPHPYSRFPLFCLCEDEDCKHMTDERLYSTDWDERERWCREDKKHDGLGADENIEDDDEHQDIEDQIGMPYELKEPGLLLACREIRQNCLPMYCGNNSFSWRFSFTDSERSFERFRDWALSIERKHARLIKQLTFEGRSFIEEGVEYEADVDIIDYYPGFKVRARYDHLPDQFLDAIRNSLELQLERMVLKSFSRSRDFPPVFSPRLIARLGAVFVDAMERELGNLAPTSTI